MAAFKVKNLWTAFLTAFFAVLTTLGLTAPAAADAAVHQPAEQPAKGGQPPVAAEERGGGLTRGEGVARVGGVTAPAVQRALPQSARPADTSRPPTIEQRIRAEAHGSSPSVRRMPVDTRTDADVARDNKSAADAALSAAA
ncbi:DUF6344 domain-containing protein [Streptomyces sp. NPDC058665]|uniref:DUF6344 domain-containing protein n=1 Tax=Streptomyces sp. NPDC058665 TaxID=3346586 RepID=UPI0036544A6D